MLGVNDFTCLKEYYTGNVTRTFLPVWDTTTGGANPYLYLAYDAMYAGLASDGEIRLWPQVDGDDLHAKLQAALTALNDQINKMNSPLTNLWLWVDPNCFNSPYADCYYDTPAENVNFIQTIVTFFQKQYPTAPIGITSPYGTWVNVTGNSQQFSHLPLRWAIDDGIRNFGDYKPFGGWAQPTWKSVKESEHGICGLYGTYANYWFLNPNAPPAPPAPPNPYTSSP
jgi:hypothetical protein